MPEVAHILSFYPMGSKLSLYSLYGQWFLRYGPIVKLAIYAHESWPLAKVPEVAHILSFCPRGSKLSLFLFYGQWFPRYGLIFKLVIFGHETLPSAIVPEVAYTLFLPKGFKFQSATKFLILGRLPRKVTVCIPPW